MIVLLTGDEETSQASLQWLLKEHHPLVDAEMAFNADSGGVTVKAGRPVLFDLQSSEKVYADYRLEVTDAGGHSSLARPGNPIYVLSAALARIGGYQFPLHLTDGSRLFFERAAATEQGQTALDMRRVAAVPLDPAAAARLSRSPFLNANLRTTCVATRVEAGHANNALPQVASAVINCRILPGLQGTEVETVIRKLAGPTVRVSVLEPPVSSPPSPVTSALLGRIEPLAAKYWPGIPVVPTMSTGATDGMYTRSAGIPTYGVSGLTWDVDDVRAHGRDERISVGVVLPCRGVLVRLDQGVLTAPKERIMRAHRVILGTVALVMVFRLWLRCRPAAAAQDDGRARASRCSARSTSPRRSSRCRGARSGCAR